MRDFSFKLKLPFNCSCGHLFQIDPVGVQPWTDIVCPACQKIDHISQEVVDQVVYDYMDAMGELYDDEDDYQKAMSILVDAPDRQRAKVVEDGF